MTLSHCIAKYFALFPISALNIPLLKWRIYSWLYLAYLHRHTPLNAHFLSPPCVWFPTNASLPILPVLSQSIIMAKSQILGTVTQSVSDDIVPVTTPKGRMTLLYSLALNKLNLNGNLIFLTNSRKLTCEWVESSHSHSQRHRHRHRWGLFKLATSFRDNRVPCYETITTTRPSSTAPAFLSAGRVNKSFFIHFGILYCPTDRQTEPEWSHRHPQPHRTLIQVCSSSCSSSIPGFM